MLVIDFGRDIMAINIVTKFGDDCIRMVRIGEWTKSTSTIKGQ